LKYVDLPTFSTFPAALPTQIYPQFLILAFEPTGVWHGERTSAEFGRQRDLVWHEGLGICRECWREIGRRIGGTHVIFVTNGERLEGKAVPALKNG